MFNAKAKDIEDDIRQLIPQEAIMQNGSDSPNVDATKLNSNHSNDKEEGALKKEEIIVIVRRVTMGMGSRNPIERVIKNLLKYSIQMKRLLSFMSKLQN